MVVHSGLEFTRNISFDALKCSSLIIYLLQVMSFPGENSVCSAYIITYWYFRLIFIRICTHHTSVCHTTIKLSTNLSLLVLIVFYYEHHKPLKLHSHEFLLCFQKFSILAQLLYLINLYCILISLLVFVLQLV